MEADIYVYAPDLTVADGSITPVKFASSVYGLVGEVAALGSVSAGSSVRLSRADHVHPTTGLAVLASANTFTAQQTITPATSVTGLVVNAASSAVGLIVKPNGTDAIQVQNEAGSSTVFRVGRLGSISVGDAIYSTASGSRAFLQPNGDTSGFMLGTNGAANKGLIIKAAASQTADLQQWQASDATVLTAVSSSGRILSNQRMSIGWLPSTPVTDAHVNFGNDYTASRVVALFRGAASQSADLTQWQDSGTTVRASVSSAGAFTISPSAGTALTVNGANGSASDVLAVNSNGSTGYLANFSGVAFVTTGGRISARTTYASASLNTWANSATNPAFDVLGAGTGGAATQTADLARYRSFDGTNYATLGGRNALAQIYSGSTAPATVATGGAISGTSSGTTATLTSASAHGLAVGDIVTIASMTPSGYNGTYLVATVPTTTTFTVTTSGSNLGNSTVSGTASVPAQASITARSAGTIGLQLRSAASQVANIMRIEDSSGTTLLRVTSAGNLQASNVMSLSSLSIIGEANSGGQLTMTRQTAAAANPGANIGRLYFRDGTNANTLKLVVRAGAAGAETTILDNIPT